MAVATPAAAWPTMPTPKQREPTPKPRWSATVADHGPIARSG